MNCSFVHKETNIRWLNHNQFDKEMLNFGSPVEPTMLPGIHETPLRAGVRYTRGWESVSLLLARNPIRLRNDDGYGSDRDFHNLKGARHRSIFLYS